MKIGWIAMIALLLLVVAKIGLMQLRAGSADADADGLFIQAHDGGAVKATARPLWKPILL